MTFPEIDPQVAETDSCETAISAWVLGLFPVDSSAAYFFEQGPYKRAHSDVAPWHVGYEAPSVLGREAQESTPSPFNHNCTAGRRCIKPRWGLLLG